MSLFAEKFGREPVTHCVSLAQCRAIEHFHFAETFHACTFADSTSNSK